MFSKERAKWMELLESEREAHRKQVQELLNRIAQPERPIVEASPVQIEPQPMKREDIELAFIGKEIPAGTWGSEIDEPTGQD